MKETKKIKEKKILNSVFLWPKIPGIYVFLLITALTFLSSTDQFVTISASCQLSVHSSLPLAGADECISVTV